MFGARGFAVRLKPTLMPTPIRVILAEDHRTLREGLKMLLEIEGDIEVIAQVESGREAVAAALEQRPEVIVMDVSLVGLDGIEATRQLRDQGCEVAVLMLSARPELHVVRAALDAGALGYLLKRTGGDELRNAVRGAAKGHPYFSQEVTHALRQRAQARASRLDKDEARAENPGAALTGRELEILQLIAGGHTNREIAEMLSVSIKTVETHRMHLMEKLDLHDVASLTRYAIRKGIIEW